MLQGERQLKAEDLVSVYEHYMDYIQMQQWQSISKNQRSFGRDYKGVYGMWEKLGEGEGIRPLQLLTQFYQGQSRRLEQVAMQEKAEFNEDVWKEHKDIIERAKRCREVAKKVGKPNLRVKDLYEELCQQHSESLPRWLGFCEDEKEGTGLNGKRFASFTLNELNSNTLKASPFIRYFRITFDVPSYSPRVIFCLDQLQSRKASEGKCSWVLDNHRQQRQQSNLKEPEIKGFPSLPSEKRGAIKSYNYSSVLMVLLDLKKSTIVNKSAQIVDARAFSSSTQPRVVFSQILGPSNYEMIIYMEWRELRLPSLFTLSADPIELQKFSARLKQQETQPMELALRRSELLEAFTKLPCQSLAKPIKRGNHLFSHYLPFDFEAEFQQRSCLIQLKVTSAKLKQDYKGLEELPNLIWPEMNIAPLVVFASESHSSPSCKILLMTSPNETA